MKVLHGFIVRTSIRKSSPALIKSHDIRKNYTEASLKFVPMSEQGNKILTEMM